MTAAVGHPTLRLIRWAIGDLTLAGLLPGERRTLQDAEVLKLKRTLKGGVTH
jgi:23S rRNA pseudouridine2457 synthase